MSIDLDKIVTQDETGEPAAVDQVESRVEAEMEQIEDQAKRSVADGLDATDSEADARKKN